MTLFSRYGERHEYTNNEVSKNQKWISHRRDCSFRVELLDNYRFSILCEDLNKVEKVNFGVRKK